MSVAARPLQTGLVLLLLAACAPPGYETAAFTQVNWPTNDQPLSIADRIEIEGRLKALKYLNEPADGVITATTRSAIRRFQTDIGVPATGFISVPLVDALRTSTAFLTADELRATSRGVAVTPQRSLPPVVPVTTTRSTSTSSSSSGGSGGGSGGSGGGGGGAWN